MAATASGIRVTPVTNQTVSTFLTSDITYICNVTDGEVERRAAWEVDGRQLVPSETYPARRLFERMGIFVEEARGPGVAILTIDRAARLTFMDTGITVRCLALGIHAVGVLGIGQFFYITTYGLCHTLYCFT